jgi:hypothetical protein
LENLEGGSFTRKFHRQLKKVLETEGLSMEPLWRTWKEGSLTGNSESYERMSRKALEMEHLSAHMMQEGNLEGGILYGGLQQTCNRGYRKRIISFIGLYKGNLAREGLAAMFIGKEPKLHTFFCYV